jgi:hypothetical protein
MKKIIIVLFVAIPCLCFGQIEGVKVVASNNDDHIIELLSGAVSNIRIPGEPIKRDSSFHLICTTSLKNVKEPLYIIDGVPMRPDSLINIINDIESVSILKNTSFNFCENNNVIILITTKRNTDVYEIKVLDPGYESFLLTQKSKDYYSLSSLKVKNTFMVNKWNTRYLQPLRYNPNIYEVNIDYDANTYYGLEFEYRLYMFFKFMEKEHAISLLNS